MVMPSSNTGIHVGYLAGRFPGKVGHLFSPGDQKGPFPFMRYGLDNGAFPAFTKGTEWEEGPWLDLLDWAKLSGQAPVWALAPDAVGNRAQTLRRWELYAPRLAQYGWPMAFAVQDGMTASDVPSDVSVVFVGGSTEWKWQTVAMWCKAFPRVHVGRVNSYRRLWECHDAGAESCDGTGWFRGDQKQLRGIAAYLEESTGKSKRILQMELIA